MSEQQPDQQPERQPEKQLQEPVAQHPDELSAQPSEKQPDQSSGKPQPSRLDHPDHANHANRADRPHRMDDVLNRWREAADTIPACDSQDVKVTVRWHQAGRGLRGEITVENVGSRACLLNLKPGLIPLGRDGRPLQMRSIVTLELRTPAYVVLEPGKRAVSPVSWRSWCGETVSRNAIVK